MESVESVDGALGRPARAAGTGNYGVPVRIGRPKETKMDPEAMATPYGIGSSTMKALDSEG